MGDARGPRRGIPFSPDPRPPLLTTWPAGSPLPRRGCGISSRVRSVVAGVSVIRLIQMQQRMTTTVRNVVKPTNLANVYYVRRGKRHRLCGSVRRVKARSITPCGSDAPSDIPAVARKGGL